MAYVRKLFISWTGVIESLKRGEFNDHDARTALFFLHGKSIEQMLATKEERVKLYLGEKGVETVRMVLKLAEEQGRLKLRTSIFSDAFLELNELVMRAGLRAGIFPPDHTHFDKGVAQVIIERTNNLPGCEPVIRVIR